ncbi:OmpA family protein [Sulfurimonas sp.]|uniref:OmpA family protein n=1 Tax=Sulfurimonas sp. TaxID=2022749 RepID=UPI002B4592D8|nr:OmpA family protein [Sulfurimonas sp.]
MLKQNKDENQNFWVSYADLMAGLLFVFILVVGAIVVKTLLMQSDLETIRINLEKEKSALEMSESELFSKKSKLRELVKKLRASREENLKLSLMISRLESETNELKDNISLLNSSIETKASKLSLNEREMQSLKELLLASEEDADMLGFKIDILNKESSQLKSFIKNANIRHELDSTFIKIRDEEIAQLEKALLYKSRDYQRVVEDLNITKIKIKNLTGIKISVVRRLKKKLGNSIEINPKTGALSFSSNILFNQGKSELKPSAKKELSRVLGRYIDVLLSDAKIRRYIDLITIEGHTNSDGSYLYNLDLSQKRALAVMHFLYKRYPKKTKVFQKYLSASGRSFAEPILYKNNKEDKDASRRIEIKFRIKNKEAVQELMNYLNKKEKKR